MANKYMRRCSTLLVITEMQIKTPMKYYIPIRMTKLKKTDHTKCSWWYGGTGTHPAGGESLVVS